MSNYQDKLRQYAQLLVRVGMNVQDKQPVFIRSSVEALELTHLVVEEAYIAGASDVRVEYADPRLKRLKFEHESLDHFENNDVKSYDVEARMDFVKRGAANLAILTEDPDLLSGIDASKLKAYQLQYSKAYKGYMEASQKNQFPWVVAAFPSKAWAQRVYPDKSVEDAYTTFVDEVFDIVRVDGNDPIQNWQSHVKNLSVHADKLQKKQYKALHYLSEGTDLVVGLPKGHIWEDATSYVNGDQQAFIANIPTEEVFTAPDRNNVNGYVTNKLPLSFNGNIIDGFTLTFKDGEIIDFKADKGEDVLRDLLDTDEGAKRLGEVALVPDDSPISNRNTIFYNTLFDENASCHLAIGSAYGFNIEGGTEMTTEEKIASGLNDSNVHEDFMIGSADLTIYGILEDDTKELVFENGNWAN
ncbi:aminopeptidase [Staphylococcus warneri]|uniref:aminopeptidase n=1 Tax=Staphylococcus TaxID=1279 RepID=UPI0002AD65F8|nr:MULTISPECIES: aminopeptidase [Staphylococcus]AGC90236.1 putative aminopeptidase [Staphylococcus warneri SG1]MCC8990309.1 aminopeptidase [Staphylococcus sp.]SKR87850.1 Aminopeptidase pepS [Mycobacteroides abscessus subsp. abscessus]KEK48695.1 thermophilic metalloprotease family protein [Staphylococcus warneri Lyso 1 2011]KEK55016.1 thermophilic metalloprotease family protein [Staphylococcus warneri Lyso 2 2011]